MDRSGNECQVIPQKEDKDTSWQDVVFDSCVDVISSGEMPGFEVLNGCFNGKVYAWYREAKVAH